MSKFASLTAGLLARKGEAEPAATPFADELLTRVGSPASDIRALTPMHAHGVPANTHTHRPPAPKPLVAMELEVKPIDEIVEPPKPKPAGDTVMPIFGSFGRRTVQELERARHDVEMRALPRPTVVPAPVASDEEEHTDTQCVACPGPQTEDTSKTYHVNLRLKRQRFIKLKLSAALLRRPVQDIVSEALDHWFDKLPTEVLGDCACMRAKD